MFAEKVGEFACHPLKLLVIGWRATEEHFLGLLRNRLTGLKPGVHIYIVNGPKPANYDPQSDEVRVRIFRALADNRPASGNLDRGGFTDFILSSRAEQFLAS